MFRPKIPTMPQPTGLVTPPALVESTTVTPAAQAPQMALAATSAPFRPAVQLTPGTALALVGGGTAVVLIVGAVLVSMLLAVAVTATSTAVCAVVIRSLLTRR
ncbi:SpdD-like protein [Streptomyces sp. NPDC012510]|uniref:SpdD-like protein n=1 Tax=Streptomyces sp. NPDC012510 TaxID=3364838 RepID=UPI0036EEEDFB